MNLNEEANQLRRDLEEADRMTVRVALFGQPGAGKSSLINALLDRDEAEVGVHTDTTKTMSCHSTPTVPGVELCDLPGYGTSQFPQDTYFRTFKVDSFDLFICVTSGKLLQADTEFFRYLVEHARPCIFVFNKHDQLWQRGKSVGDLEREKTADISKQLGRQTQVIFTSCREEVDGSFKGIEELKTQIAAHLSDVKRDRWTRSVKARTAESLDKKRKASKKRVVKACALAVVNGALNPVPGADLAADLAVIANMRAEIRRDFGLTDADVTALDGQGGTSQAMMQPLLNLVVKQIKARLLLKLPTRFIPILGNIIGGTVSLSACIAAGNAYVDACHDYVADRLAAKLAH